jgi:uncharacterized protein
VSNEGVLALVVVCAVALVASGLTFFTGFGLGTLLLPAFALFFPVETAVAMTAVVHLANNLFKLALVGRRAAWRVVLVFGAPAVAGAWLGALALARLSHLPELYRGVTPVELVIAVLMTAFALLELWPWFKALAVPTRLLPLGGLVTGAFGGLSGHQGAFRSAFLLKLGLPKDSFIATGVVIACLVDITRLGVYAERFFATEIADEGALLVSACASAFAGALAGSRLLEKVSLRTVEIAVAILLVLVAAGLASGVL